MPSEDRLILLDEEVRIEPDPDSPEMFCAWRTNRRKRIRLTPAKAYLAENMRRPYSDVVLIAKCNARFSDKHTLGDLQELIEDLDEAEMMTGRTRESGTSHKTNLVPASEPPGTPRRFRNHWSLMKPQRFLDFLLPAVGWMRYLKVLVPLAFVLAVFGFVNNLDMFFMDIASIKNRVSFFGRLVFTFFTISLATQLHRGLTARYFGFETPSFGVMLVFGLLPRFNMRVTVPEDAKRKARLWTLGVPLYVRFIMFPLGIVVWLSSRGQGNFVSHIGAGVAMLSLISFLFVANPLLGGAGYRFLSELFAVQNLRKKAFLRLKSIFGGQPQVIKQYMDPSPAALYYGLASIGFTLALAGFIGFGAARWLEMNYQGLGVTFFIFLLAYVFIRLTRKKLKQWRQRRRAKSAVEDTSHRCPPTCGPMIGRDRSRKFFVRGHFLFRFFFFILLLGICFLPYQYESGGEAEVFPKASAQIYAEHPDLIGEVYCNGGEILGQGTVIAELVNDRQKNDVEKTREELKKKQEELNILLTTPTPEQLALAREEVGKAEVMAKYSQEQFDRINILYEEQVVSYADYEGALRQLELDRQLLRAAMANLNYVKKQVNEHQIKASRIEIEILRNQLAYYGQVLDRTRLKMPIDGKIITMNLKNLKGSFLDTDYMFAQVEDISSARVEIRIPESDMDQITLGDKVKLRLLAYPNQTFECRLEKIYPATVEDALGRYVICECIKDNGKELFRSGMTGFAKIEGKKMFVVTAYTRALVRFFQVEVWSWLP